MFYIGLKARSRKLWSLLLFIPALFVFSCDEVTHPDDHNDQELITTVRLTYIDTTDTAKKMVVQFRDLDGEGGSPPEEMDTLLLEAGNTYYVSLEFLNETEPEDHQNITEELREEGDEHQVFYIPEGISIAVQYDDQDVNGLPLGIETIQTPSSSGMGGLKVVLKHQPDIKSQSSSVNDGESDVEISFPVRVN